MKPIKYIEKQCQLSDNHIRFIINDETHEALLSKHNFDENNIKLFMSLLRDVIDVLKTQNIKTVQMWVNKKEWSIMLKDTLWKFETFDFSHQHCLIQVNINKFYKAFCQGIDINFEEKQ